jgi:hypothetical protein
MNKDPAAEPRQSFLQRRPIRRALGRALRHWLERHRHPFNFWIHMVGIPLALAGVILFFARPWEQWYWGLGAFIGGYVLQYLGHRVEGNDLGEWAAIKRLFGLPYVGIAPRCRETEVAAGARGP